MASSVTEIQNSALVKLGAERILSEDDANNRARLVKQQYPLIRDSLLRSHPWKFARKRFTTTPIDPKPAGFYEATFVSQLPLDCLRIIDTSLDAIQYWDREGDYFLCNDTPVTVKYIARISDVSKFDGNFCEVLAWALAADICYALTQNAALTKLTQDTFKLKLQEARSFNAQQGSAQRMAGDEWLDVRRY